MKGNSVGQSGIKDTIVQSVVINAAIADVWTYFTEREKIAAWLMPNTFVPNVGHEFTMLCANDDGSEGVVHSKILEI